MHNSKTILLTFSLAASCALGASAVSASVVSVDDPVDPAAAVYGTATLTYAEFYSGDVSSTDDIDAVTSATIGKHDLFRSVDTDFVDEASNPDGYHILGVKDVHVAVAPEDVDAYKEINPTFAESDEVPAQYKTVTIKDGAASYSATTFNVADTVSDADLEVLTDSHWGDYQINILETSTQYLRNTREDGDFALEGGIQGAIVETASGLKVGMQHLQSLWVQPYEISWNVSVDNSHNPDMTFDNLAELDKLMGETVTKVTYINADDAYIYEFDGAYLPIKFESSLSVENAASTAGTTAVTVTGLPDDYEQTWNVEGLESETADGALTWSDALPGAYTLTLTDGNGVYAQLTADFVLDTDELPAAFDAEALEVVAAEGHSEEELAAFLANLETVTVNGTDYAAAGRGAAVIINEAGELDTEAVLITGRGEEATETPIFAEAGEYEITAKAVGFNEPLSFTVSVEA